MTFNLASFLNMTLKAKRNKRKIRKTRLQNQKLSQTIGHYPKNIIIVKRKPRRKKIFINHLSDKSLICRLYGTKQKDNPL